MAGRYILGGSESKERLLQTPRKGYTEFGFNNSVVDEDGARCWCFRSCFGSIDNFWNVLQQETVKIYKMGVSDPRKVVFAVKMDASLIFVSFLMLFKESLRDLSQYSIWAIIIVVVVIEFSVGATFNKGFNRAIGTLFDGALALRIAELSVKCVKYEEVILLISIFIAGFVANEG